jgi:hypothetical protein
MSHVMLVCYMTCECVLRLVLSLPIFVCAPRACTALVFGFRISTKPACEQQFFFLLLACMQQPCVLFCD